MRKTAGWTLALTGLFAVLSAAFWFLVPSSGFSGTEKSLEAIFPGAAVAIGSSETGPGLSRLDDVLVEWPDGTSLSSGSVLVSHAAPVSVTASNVRLLRPGGFDIAMERIMVEDIAPAGSIGNFSAASMTIAGLLLKTSSGMAATAPEIEITDIRSGIPLEISARNIVFLAPGRLELAASLSSMKLGFDPFLRTSAAAPSFRGMETSIRSLTAQGISLRLAGVIPLSMEAVSFDLRPVLGLGGEAREGTLDARSARLGNFGGDAGIGRALALQDRPVEIEASFRRSAQGEWSVPSASLREPSLGSLSASMDNVFSEFFSGELVFEERTLFQRILQARALSADISVGEARNSIVSFFADFFGPPSAAAFADFASNPREISVIWAEPPDFNALEWSAAPRP